MRKIVWTGGLLLLATSTLAATPCTPSPTTLCLNASRFEVDVSWRDSRGRTGVGQAVSITADTGYFWFFSETNIELVVKVLDARALNQKYWVFFGALSSVEYDLTVTDTVTGAVKTYHNPLGQFASVGDTDAFASLVDAPPTNETVEVAGTASPPESLAAMQSLIDTRATSARNEFTPCRSAGAALRLNGCRFVLDVSWRDARGREGIGTPVQLTDDTGYFWFFSPANVELVIKVLDARSVNGSHWVFYGALSNVEYTLTVRDSMTGAVRSYTNPGGAFASVGDTQAFHAGRSVRAVPDPAGTVFATFDAAGGTLSATGADGTHYELELPPDALGMEMTVRMTPLARVEGLPLSRGLVGAVQLEPEGLRLFVPATLHIRPPAPLRKGIVGFSYHGPGEDFALDYGEAAAGEVRVPVLHFSGAGAGAAGPGDVASQSSSVPLDTVAYVRQLALQIIDRAQPHEDEDGNVIEPEITPEEAHDSLVALFIDVANNFLLPRLAALLPSCNVKRVRAESELALATTRFISLFTDVGRIPELQEAVQEIIDKIIEILERCLPKLLQDCIAQKDPFIAWDMVAIMRKLQLFGVDVEDFTAPGSDVERCLRFKLHFDATLTVTSPAISESLTASAAVPLRIDPSTSGNAGDVAWSGFHEISLTHATSTAPGCTTTGYEFTSGQMFVGGEIPTRLLPLASGGIADDPEQFTSFPIRVGYDPGVPTSTAFATCSGFPTDFGQSQWRLYFEEFHEGEHVRSSAGSVSSGYLAEGWELFNFPRMFARKTYQGTKTAGVNRYGEEVQMIIEHTPDAAD